ncbi:MAG: hypothetical protein A07HR60_02867 [uncultured archaeon A07HR60]|nr:MAG: hypothetical protein A07HR60_02867 [uncultured archaeon A07HR60]
MSGEDVNSDPPCPLSGTTNPLESLPTHMDDTDPLADELAEAVEEANGQLADDQDPTELRDFIKTAENDALIEMARLVLEDVTEDSGTD